MRLGSAAFFEGNCDEINKLTELITSGLSRSPEKQNGKKAGKSHDATYMVRRPRPERIFR